MSNVEAMIWVWIYMGMAVGAIALIVVLAAILYENRND